MSMTSRIKMMTGWILAIAGLFAFRADARTISVASQTEGAVTFAFGAQDGMEYGLYFAHGPTDGDEDKRAWASYEKIADIADDQTSYTYEVPAALRDGRPMRFFLMQTLGVACAKELDSVKSTGDQWVDTGYTPNNRTVVDFRFGEVTYVNATAFFGQGWNNKCYLLNQQGSSFYFHGDNNTAPIKLNITPQANTDYRCVIDDNGGSARLFLSYGSTTNIFNVSRAVSSGNMAIFSINSGASNRCSSFRFYRMKIVSMGSAPKMQRDFIPALDAEGVAGLYDQANNVFYKSKTDVPLEAGNELSQDRFGRVVDSTPTFRFRRTMTITSANASTVTFAFGNPGTSAYKLYAASGNTDCGGDKNAWTAFTEVATIASNATSYTCSLPAALRNPGAYYRFFLVQTDNLPYDSEVASLKSSGAQCVWLGYAPGADTKTDFRFGDVTYVGSTTFFGQGWNGYNYLFNQQGNGFRFHGNGVTVDTAVHASTDYRLQLPGERMVALRYGDTVLTTRESYEANPLSDMAVFACPSKTSASTFRFDAMTIWDNGLLVRDLIPVVVNGAGALYDRANNVVHHNLTGNDFTHGATLTRTGRVIAETQSFRTNASGVGEPPLPSFIQLTEDTDWVQGGVSTRLAPGGTVDLNGYTLHLSAPETDSVFSTFTLAGDSGTLHLTVPDGATYGGASLLIDGAIGIVKDGGGTWKIAHAIPRVTGITIEGGIVKMDGASYLPADIPIEVKDGTAFDYGGYGNNVPRLTIAGTGPDGVGALRNTGGDIANSVPQMASLTLTGDATVYGKGHLGLINNGNAPTTFELNGHTLTVNLTSGRGFWFCNTTGSTPGTVYVLGGIPYFCYQNVSLPNVDFILTGADSLFRIPDSNPSTSIIIKSLSLYDGAALEEGYQSTRMQNLSLFENAKVGRQSYVKWIYVADTILVSNETSIVTNFPPFTAYGTYPKLVKKGAGTFLIANNYTDQRIDGGVEIFGGTVVMSTSRTGTDGVPHKAISSQPVPVIIHSGGTLDIRQCTQPFLLKSLVIDEGGTILHDPENVISFRSATTFTKPEPFSFTGTVNFTVAPTFDLTDLFAGAGAPAAGSSITLLTAGSITASSGIRFNVKGCPYDYDIDVSPTAVTLRTFDAGATLPDPIKIWTVGGNLVYGNATTSANFRFPLARLLTADGWNVKMTGWRTTSPNGGVSSSAWGHHCGIVDLALKTSATRAGLLEGLETYAAAASEPDFTILVCGDTDVADGVASATVLANYQAAVTRIKAALPMTTVIASTIPGASLGANAALNADITAWCATQSDVECVDLASVMTTAITAQECDDAAALLKAKLLTLATANGKNTPSTWTRPTVTLGAENNVPAEYRAGYTRVRSIEPTPTLGYAQNLYTIPYAYAPPMKETGITKVAYYIELVRKDTGALQALWVDMDAPGPNWADVAFPVTLAQQKQQAVTKLHVWSNFGGVSVIPANDDTVKGYIEFNPINYSGGDKTTEGVITEPWAGKYGFTDTFNTSGSSGHGCFQLMRKFDDPNACPAGEILFAYNRWGSTSESTAAAMGMGTLANYGTLGYSTDKSLDWTFVCDSEGTDLANICSLAYSFIRIDFWVQYDGATPTRTELADAVWSGASGASFDTPANWTASGGAASTLADSNLLIPQGATPSFTYIGYDPVNLSGSTLMVDGTATFPNVGGIYLASLDMGATGKLVYDPVKFSIRTASLPTFASGAKIALTPNYAANTKGRFLLMTWNAQGELDRSDAELNALFDTSSASGADVKVWAEYLPAGGGRLWLDLNYAATYPQLNVLCVGDSITQGNNGSYGNWRIFLMKRLAAAGYTPVAKGHWNIQSHDICGAEMPTEWIYHSGISAQRLITGAGAAGTIDAIETMLDCAGDVDFVLVKLGTNDINSGGRTAEMIFPVWQELVWKTLNQKPHAKFIAGAVVDIANNPTLDAQVVAFNTKMKNAIEGGVFPVKRTYFADLYTPCYRYDGNHNYIVGSFQNEGDLHPDWPGEDKMAETYCAAILDAIADDPDFVPGAAETVTETTTGAENNVPAAYRAGFTRARSFDIAAYGGQSLTTLGYVPYSVVNDAAPAADLSRVGYYIELKRRDNAFGSYHGLVRWIWVSMDAFGDRTLGDVGIPLTSVNQRVVKRLRVVSNMPGIESTGADATGVRGWIEFWPSTYDTPASGLYDAPAKTYRCDWNDKRSNNMSGYGTMQVHRFTPGAANPAQVMFAFNRWAGGDCYEIGIGNFAHQGKSIDQTWMGDANTREMMTSLAYEVAKIEIWTASSANDPDAPNSALVYLTSVTAEGSTAATVTGSLEEFGGDATNATVTLEWSADPAFATVAGSVSLGEMSEPGSITATATGLTAGQTWYFRFTSTNSNGATATSDTSDPLSFDAGYWRPQTAADTWTSVAWLKDDAGAPVAFNPVWTAVFDGQEQTKTATVSLPEEVSAKSVRVEGAQNYTFDGAGAIAAPILVKEGTGVLTLENRALANVADIEVRGGTVKLGDSAVAGAAGLAGGTITVKNGGQFDVNYTDETGGADRPRAQITNRKKFVIEGDGSDRQGALITSSTASGWNTALDGGVELTGDATIGGVGRLEIRNAAITGPTNATLTVAMRTTSNNYGFGINSAISVGKVVIADAAKMKFEGSALSIDIPNGIDLYGSLRFYGADGTWNTGGITARGAGAVIGNDNGTANIRTPVTVDEGATLTMINGSATRYKDVFTNKGTVVVTGSGHYFDGPVVNEGNPLLSQTTHFYNYATTVTGDSRLNVSGGYYWASGITDWRDSALDVALSGGGGFTLGINNDGYGYPKFGRDKLTVTAASGHSGTFYLHANTSCGFDGITITGPLKNFYAQGPNNGAVIDSFNSNLVVTATDFRVGTGNGRGEHTFTGPETSISATTLTVDAVESTTYAGRMNVAGGLLTIGSGGILSSWKIPNRDQFVMENGTLRAGADFALTQMGMTARFGNPRSDGSVTFDLNGKTVKWGTALAGGSDVTLIGSGTFSTVRPGIQGIPFGKWTVNSTGENDLRNAAGFAGGLALGENVNATLDIAGTNLVEFLAWTWHGNAWNVMKPLFEGNKVTTPHVASSLTFFNRPASKIRDIKNNNSNGTGFNYYGQFYVRADQAGKWYFAQRNMTHFGIQIDNTELSRLGPNNGGIYNIDLTEGWHNFMISIYTGETDQTIGPMTDSGDLAAQNGIWFKVGGSGDGSWPNDYTPFDTTTVPMRMRQELCDKTSVRWRIYRSLGNSSAEYGTADESKYTFDVITNSLQLVNQFYSGIGTNAPLGGASARFDGYFYVSPEKAGQWTFSADFDDRIALEIDDRRLITTASIAEYTARTTLHEGWHKFGIRTADGSTAASGGVGGKLTDADGNVCAVRFKVDNGDYHAFDERYLPISAGVGDAQKFAQPGLGGEIELAAGSTLTNEPREGGYCPIYGTLKGTGTLSGPYRFTGEDNCWEVSGTSASLANTVTFADADAQTLAGLKRVKAVFSEKPGRTFYTLSDALGLTAEAAAAVALEVADTAGNDYSDAFTLLVDQGKLKLKNGSPTGSVLFIR